VPDAYDASDLGQASSTTPPPTGVATRRPRRGKPLTPAPPQSAQTQQNVKQIQVPPEAQKKAKEQQQKGGPGVVVIKPTEGQKSKETKTKSGGLVTVKVPAATSSGQNQQDKPPKPPSGRTQRPTNKPPGVTGSLRRVPRLSLARGRTR
jgi:hypothetical protein